MLTVSRLGSRKETGALKTQRLRFLSMLVVNPVVVAWAVGNTCFRSWLAELHFRNIFLCETISED
jgi:hypothetical protein